MRKSLLLVLCAIAGVGQAIAQNFPSRTIRIITGATGGGIDMNAREVGTALANAFGQPTVIENRGGGGGIMAGELTAKAQRDGHTIMVYSSNIWLLPLLRGGVPYDPIKDFDPIMLISGAPNVLVVPVNLPVKSVKDLIAMAKAQPGKLNYAHAGIGGAVHLAAEMFVSNAGLQIQPVAYASNPAAYADVITGQVQMMFAIPSTVMQLVEAGRLRALGVSTLKPTALTPGLPTIAEAGLPGFEHSSLIAVFAPSGTNPAAMKKLSETLVRWIRSPETREMFFKRGSDTYGGTPAELGALVKTDMAKWAKVIKERGIRAE